jgi:hypothetical protein
MTIGHFAILKILSLRSRIPAPGSKNLDDRGSFGHSFIQDRSFARRLSHTARGFHKMIRLSSQKGISSDGLGAESLAKGPQLSDICRMSLNIFIRNCMPQNTDVDFVSQLIMSWSWWPNFRPQQAGEPLPSVTDRIATA